jgi:LytS/YehU family sensor histidine kinase
MVSGVHEFNMFATSISLMIDILIITSVFVAITIIYSRYESDQLNRKLEKESLQIELNFLKAQINPHFLLNTLNTIYYKIDKQNTEARDILMKFSDMLKYQLYESNSGMVSIDKELEYLKNYVNLQRVRLNEDYDVNFNCDDNLTGFGIPVNLLIPFVENAFKHVSHFEDASNEIKINLTKQNEVLCLEVYNTKEEDEIRNSEGGIGLMNVKRRLKLLFPDKHELHIEETEKSYEVKLKLSLS